MSRKVLWIIFFGALALILGLKAVQLGWFTPHLLLELDGEPALLFFNKSRGCECEMFVYNNAEAQMNSWNASVQVIRIDMERRPDLVKQYKVIRAPSLILLDSGGQVVWRQNESTGDESPLNLVELGNQIAHLAQNFVE